MAKVHGTKVTTGVVRLSYANVWEPRSINGSDPKYSCSILIPKNDTETVEAIKAAIEQAIQDGIASKWNGKKPAGLKLPLRDGDEDRPDDENYKGMYFINANSKQPPQIVDRAVKPILDQTEVYSGCYVRVSVNFYAFNQNGNRGVACGLGNIQKVKDGDSLMGRSNAADDFDAEDDDDFLA